MKAIASTTPYLNSVDDIGFKWASRIQSGSLAVGSIIAIGSAASLATKMQQKAKVKRQTKEQMKELKEEQKEKREKKRPQRDYGYVNFGQVAFDLFAERTGHFKMGNARFKN